MTLDILSKWTNVKPTYKSKEQFKKAKPFSHIVIHNFLKSDKAELLFKELKKQSFVHKESDLFSYKQTNDLESCDNNVLKDFYLFAGSEEFAEMIGNITGLDVKPGALDLAGSLYQGGDYLLCHDDQVEDRKIAYILYLSKDFKEKDGASLVLFDSKNGKPGKEAKKYSPEWNSLMIFEVSNVSFHSVEENMGDKDRYTIGGWLH